MKMRVRWEARQRSGARTTLLQPISLLDRLIAYSLIFVVLLTFSFFLMSLFALASGPGASDLATGRTFEISLGWRTETSEFVAPWFGRIYGSVKLALEIAGGVFLLLAGAKWLTQP